ncbi:MAG: SIMPL domain-containing protein [Opitutaceae bacterium]|nr:SIMPL domain-containing protein [Opitutaceae bacterium]
MPFPTFMENPRPHLFGLLAGLFLATGIAFASLVVAGAWTRIAESQVINVTGSARKNVRSDLVIWRAGFSTDASTLLEAQQKLRADYAIVEKFLQAKGASEVAVLPVQIRELTVKVDDDSESARRRVGYRLSQSIEVHATDVELLPRLSAESTELLEQGVAFMSESIEFIYTKANEAKVEMMAEATKDARARADQIALQGGRKIKELRNARMGVVQINPLYSAATSWEGNNDTTSLEKTITATVSATFSLK